MTISFDLGKTNLSSNTEFMSKTKTSEVIPVLVTFGRDFNPRLSGCGRGQKFFLSKRCAITIPIR